jgi:hypothetical protein
VFPAFVSPNYNVLVIRTDLWPKNQRPPCQSSSSVRVSILGCHPLNLCIVAALYNIVVGESTAAGFFRLHVCRRPSYAARVARRMVAMLRS